MKMFGEKQLVLALILSLMRCLHSRLCSRQQSPPGRCYWGFVNSSSRDITTRMAGEGRGHPHQTQSTARTVSGPCRRTGAALDLGLPAARLKGHHEKHLLKAVLKKKKKRKLFTWPLPGRHSALQEATQGNFLLSLNTR